MRVGLAFLAILAWVVAASGCDSNEPVGSTDYPSLATSASLFPDASVRRQVEGATWQLWSALQSEGCRTCHGADGAAGWNGAKMPYWAYYTSDVISFLSFDANSTDARGLHYYDLLAGTDPSLRMPPLRNGQNQIPTDADVLDALDTSEFDLAVNQLQRQGIAGAEDRYRHALGTQLVYVNTRGICFDKRNTGADAYARSLCEPLSNLAGVIQRYNGGGRRGIEQWNDVVQTARRQNHYDAREGLLVASNESGRDITGSYGGFAPVGPAQEQLVYRLGADWTISYFIKVAPDDSQVGFAATNQNAGVTYRNVIVDLNQQRLWYPDCIRYDPIFSPDYNVARGTGFTMGGRGASSNSSFNKYYTFLLPTSNLDLPGARRMSCRDENYPAARDWFLEGISGYGSIAYIADGSRVNEAWAPYQGQYIVMGKRWAWTVADTVTNADGRTVDLELTNGTRVEAGICRDLWRNTSESGVSLVDPDSMISPDGRYISLKRNSDLASVVLATRDCSIAHVVTNAEGTAIRGGKASFSNDGRYVALHGFGPDGTDENRSVYSNNGKIEQLAQETVANIFIFDMQTGRLAQLTHHVFGQARNSYVSLFPSFNGDNSRLYFHRHARGASYSEVVAIDNPLEALR